MTVASFVISCLALLAACVAALYARRQTRASEQSAAEARRAADTAGEVASIEQARRADEVAAADRHRVSFGLEHQNGQAYLLRNSGTDCAYGVHIDKAGMIVRGESDFDEFPAGDARKYVFMRTGGEADHIVITWHQSPDRSDSKRSVKLYPK